MKPEDFKKIVRLIVQEELKKQLPALIPQVLTEILAGKSKSILSEKAVEQITKPVVSEKQPLQPKEYKKYSNNPLLNDILNETVVKIKPENSPYVGYSEKPKSNIASNFSVAEESDEIVNFRELNESVEPSTPMVAEIKPVNEEQAKVLSKINRDFRGLMKAVDEKKKGGMSSFGGGVSME